MDCDEATTHRRPYFFFWRREWRLHGCRSLHVDTKRLDNNQKAQLAAALVSSTVADVHGADGDRGFFSSVGRSLAGLPPNVTLRNVPMTAMLAAALMLNNIDYSRPPDVANNNRVSRIESTMGACPQSAYVLIDADDLLDGSTANAIFGCYRRRGAFVALPSRRPLVEGPSAWLNNVLLPLMRSRHNMSLDVISSHALRELSFCDCPLPSCCAGEGAPLLFFVRDDSLLSIDDGVVALPHSTKSKHGNGARRQPEQQSVGVVMAADKKYVQGNPITFELIGLQTLRVPVSLVTDDPQRVRQMASAALTRSSSKAVKAGGGGVSSSLLEVHALHLPPSSLPSFASSSEYGFRLHKLPALLQSRFNLSIYLDVDVSLCSTSILAELVRLADVDARHAEVFVVREGRRSDGVEYIHGGVMLFRSTPLARSLLRTWLRKYLVTYRKSLDAKGVPRGSVYEQPDLTATMVAASRVLPGSVHFLPTELLARVHTGQVALYKRRVASGLPAAPLAHINGLKAAERELWRLLIGSGSNGTCGGGGTSAMGKRAPKERASTRRPGH